MNPTSQRPPPRPAPRPAPRRRRAASLLAAAVLGLAAGGAAAMKVDMYAIGNWSGGNCAPGDVDANRGSWPGMVGAWYLGMGLKGHQLTGSLVDGNMTLQRFCDPSFNPACRDYENIDWPGAVIIAAHGFDNNSTWGAVLRNAWQGRCDMRMGSAQGTTFVGEHGLRFLHASSCLSLNDTYFPNMRVAMKKVNAVSTKGLHVLTGFHGVMWISSGFNGDYADTAIDGHAISVARSWVGNHYKPNRFGCAAHDPFNWFGTCQDQCPTAMAVGPSTGNALNRLLHERYNNTSAFGDPTSRNFYAWMGYEGCDPVAGRPFNP